MAKPNLQEILGVKKKAPPKEGPPDMPMDDESDPQDAQDDLVMNDDAGGGAPGGGIGDMGGMGGDLQPSMMMYHDGSQACGSCSHFQGPATCDRWPDPVEEAAWCSGWQPQSQQQPSQPNLGPMPGAGAAPSPGGPPSGPPGAPGV